MTYTIAQLVPRHPYAEGGSISTGTLKPEDLRSAFIGALDAIKDAIITSASIGDAPQLTEARKALVCKIDDTCALAEQATDSEALDWAVNDLSDLLAELGPDGLGFGAHFGDGADFGFWPLDTDVGCDCDGED